MFSLSMGVIMSEKTARTILANPRFRSVVLEYQRSTHEQYRKALKHHEDEYNKAMNNRLSMIYRHIGVSDWTPSLELLTFDGPATTGISISRDVQYGESEVLQWSDTQQLYTFTHTLIPSIILIGQLDGKITIPKNQNEVEDFTTLNDFLDYLEGEIKQGRYPRHM
jgi:hypothetical protein